MDTARINLDWEEMINQSIDPELSRKIHYRDGSAPEDKECSMCGSLCAIRILKEALEEKRSASKKIL